MLEKVGDVYGQFTVIKATFITELQCRLFELVHGPTDAHVLAIVNDDPENLFCLSFRTLPETSNGVAHILEHTVLCGSEKFPVKDPFFAMTRRSLNTYMNALTGSDFTCYPAASQVPQDFYNLLEVYLDAVFHPKLKELSFLQEGHRLEFAIPNDPNSPLERKGIVYNEMKGDLSSPSSRLLEALTEAMYPDITYGCNSGGDPLSIPKLTYQELLDFHSKFYHPSRCLFYFYGDLPIEGHLDFLEKHILSKTEKVLQLPPIPLQPRFTEPKRIQQPFPASSTETEELIGFGWLTCHTLDQEETLSLNILEIILMETDASPLKYALLKSGLCKQANSYLDLDNSEIPFYVMLKGCQPGSSDALENVVFNTLKQIADEGIELERVENALHQLELFRSEIQGDHSPFGLSLFMRAGLIKQHGANSEEALMIHTLFDKIHKKIINDPRYLSQLILKHLVNNPHFVRVTMLPDNEQAARELAATRMDLDQIRANLSEQDVQAILDKTAELAKYQQETEEENDDVLPKITLNDVSKNVRQYPLTQIDLGDFHVYHHDCFTNGIVYADLVFDMPFVNEEDLFYVRLYTLLASQVGCGKRSYKENLEYLQAHTGGLDAFLSLNVQAQDNTQFHPYFSFRGKALYRKANKLFELLRDMATSLDFSDTERLKEIILKHHTALENSLASSAMRYATNLSASGISIPSKIANSWYGLDYFLKLRKLANNFEAYASTLAAKLQELQQHLMCIGIPHLVLSCDTLMLEELMLHRFYGLSDLKPKFYLPWSAASYTIQPVEPQGRLIASPVAFIGKVFPTISYGHPDSPALQIAAGLLDNLTLHAKIREQGGAYGAGAVSNSMAGHFYFYTYRDPNIYSSLKAFEESIQVIRKHEFDKGDLEEAKLEILQAMDTPISPGSRAGFAYAWMREGKTTSMRQAHRNRILALTEYDVIQALEKHIVPAFAKGSTVIFAGRELLEKENATLKSVGIKPFPILNIE